VHLVATTNVRPIFPVHYTEVADFFTTRAIQKQGISAQFINRQLARMQGFSRTLGPVLAVALADRTSMQFVLLAASASLLALDPATHGMVQDGDPTPVQPALFEETS
jgi:CDP-diacylglycerol pyrophosphatase